MRLGVGFFIGILLTALQPAGAQSTAAELSQIDRGDVALGRWVSGQGRSGPVGWQSIWQRFLGMGSCAEDFVCSSLLLERDRKQRLVLTGACLVTSSAYEKALLHRKIAARQHPDRIMAMFAVALGPRQAGPNPALRDWLKRAKSPLEQVVGCLALARFENAESLPDAVLGKVRDAGVLASALYCQPARPSGWIRDRLTNWASRAGAGHAHLVWRAYLLGDTAVASTVEDRVEVARRILADSGHEALQEAACFLARAGEGGLTDEEILSQGVGVRLQLAASPVLRRRLLSEVDTRLRGTVSDLLLRRWWSLFVRFGSWSDVVEALTVWDGVERFQKDASLRTSIGLALGWRLFSMSAEEAAAARPEIGRMVDTPAGVWLQLALGDTRTAATSHAGFEGLARAYPMAEAGRLPRPSVARLLEAALWHEGGHPGRAALDLHRQLQAELVIDGSAASGEGYAQRRGVQVYTAKGVARSDSPLFLVANELYRFIRREEPWSLREHRLR